MEALFLLSGVLAIAIAVAIPVFSGAVSRRIMQEELGLLQPGRHLPPFVVRFHMAPTESYPLSAAGAAAIGPWLGRNLGSSVGLPVNQDYTEVHSPSYHLMPAHEGSAYRDEYIDTVVVVWADGVEDHIQVVDGLPFAEDSSSPALRVWFPERVADELDLRTGETYLIGDHYDNSAPRILIEIAGIWTPLSLIDEYWWYTEPLWHYESMLLVPRSEYEAHIGATTPTGASFVSWRFVLDDKRMNLDRAQDYIDGLGHAERAVSRRLPGCTLDQAPTDYLVRGQQRKEAMSLVLLGLSAPLMIVILYFVASVSAMLDQTRRQETAMLVSRGAGRLQVVAMTLTETLAVLWLALPLGLAGGLVLAPLLGGSASFLRFRARPPLAVSLASANWWLIASILGAIVTVRVVATWGSSGRSIVLQERERARKSLAPGSARLVLVISLSAAAAYTLSRLNQVGSLSLVSWTPGESSHDPLLQLAPTLFLVATPLVVTELFLVLLRPLSWLGRFVPSVPIFLASSDLAREGGQYRSSVYMIVLALGLGVYYASLAKSADVWLLDRRRHEVGSDLLFNPRGTAVVAGRFGKVDEKGIAWETASIVPISQYQGAESVLAATPVGEYEAKLALDGPFPFVRLLGIDRLTFPRVAYYRDDYSSESLGDLMNRIGRRHDGLLVPSELADQVQLGIGSLIRLLVLVEEGNRSDMEFVIVGTFDHFPTMYADRALVLVANQQYLQARTSIDLPYGIWMHTTGQTGSVVTQEVIRATQVLPERVISLPELVDEDQSRLERTGLFGMLSVCFVASAVTSSLSLLVHTTAGIRRRSRRIAIIQMLGLGKGQTILMVLIEYLAVLCSSAVMGVLLGIVGGRTYIPFVRLTDQAGIPVPPYVPLIDYGRAALMGSVVVTTMVLAIVFVVVRLARIKLFQVLRMGTRE